MHQDIKHKGKVYRVISEGPNVAHPCEAIVAVFDVSNPKTPKEIYRETGFEDRELGTLARNARVFVKNL
jgi:hypothetical protein